VHYNASVSPFEYRIIDSISDTLWIIIVMEHNKIYIVH